MPESGAAMPDPHAYQRPPGMVADVRRPGAEDEICQLYQLLREAKSELQMVSAEMVAAQELERKRIATELHDSIGSSLGSIGFGMGAALARAKLAKDPELTGLLDLISVQIKSALTEVRRISQGLRPASLDDLGLISTLSWLVREFRAVHPSITLVADIALTESEIQPALRTPMFRIVQEALNNAVKYAKAAKIGISLGRSEYEICLEIYDDGVGFDPQEIERRESISGIGLRGMADRITISGGDFRLSSSPGNGTRVLACWPVASCAADEPGSSHHHVAGRNSAA
ncbi:sensor histidine kinase [Dechloromonas sp. HYN0024]|nr:sensor histidine kinase [Dechloromonas sp. HYN0024]